jgi:hypothetical protein
MNMAKRIKTRKKSGIRVPSAIQKAFPHVKKVLDAAESISVHVGKSDCAKAVSKDATECAMAKAVKREYKADGAIIGVATSYIIRDDIALRFQTPTSVAREIVSFDRHQDFEPGDYHLTPKAGTNRLGHSGGRSKNKQSGSKKHRAYHKTLKVRTIPLGSSISE